MATAATAGEMGTPLADDPDEAKALFWLAVVDVVLAGVDLGGGRPPGARDGEGGGARAGVEEARGVRDPSRWRRYLEDERRGCRPQRDGTRNELRLWSRVRGHGDTEQEVQANARHLQRGFGFNYVRKKGVMPTPLAESLNRLDLEIPWSSLQIVADSG